MADAAPITTAAEAGLAAPAETPAAPAETPKPGAEKARGPGGRYVARKAAALASLKAADAAEAPATEAPAESKPTEKPAPEAKPEALSPKLAAIARMEAKHRGEVEAWRKAQAEKEAAIAAREAKLKEWEEAEALRESDVLGYLEKRGLSYEAITKAALDGKRPEPKPKASEDSSRVADLQRQLEELQKQRLADQQAAGEREAQAYLNHVSNHIKAAGEKYELINADPDGLETVHAYIRAHAAATGKALSPDEAAAAVEEQMLADLERRSALLKTAKVSAKLFPQAAATPAAPKPAAPKPASTETGRSEVKPLSNSHASAPAPAAPRRPRFESQSERVRRVKASAQTWE